MKYPVIVSKALNSTWALARSKGPFIFVRPEYKDNLSIYLHELTHVKQWYIMTVGLMAISALLCYVLPEAAAWWPGLLLLSLLMHNGLYNINKTYRLWSEVQAYRVQAMGDPSVLPMFAQSLSELYGLGLTPDEALLKLQK